MTSAKSFADDRSKLPGRPSALSARDGLLNTILLFSSASTLVCCALPALFVAVGAGATLASLATNVPGLIWLSENKVPLFIFAGVMLAIAGYVNYRNRNAPCPVDPGLARACQRQRSINSALYFLSLGIYLVGFFFAFVAVHLLA